MNPENFHNMIKNYRKFHLKFDNKDDLDKFNIWIYNTCNDFLIMRYKLEKPIREQVIKELGISTFEDADYETKIKIRELTDERFEYDETMERALVILTDLFEQTENMLEPKSRYGDLFKKKE